MIVDTLRTKLFAADRLEFVTEGNDDGRPCWRTYVGMVDARGVIEFHLQPLAYSPPNDWQELKLPGA